MDIKSGYPWWTVTNGLIGTFPPLTSDIRCDVAIIGAGITGSLIGHSLAQAGLEVVILDRGEVAWGSTSASTALLQYEIDTPLSELAARYGEEAAKQAYLACDEAIDRFASVANELGHDVGFHTCGSLYFASHRWHTAAMREEYALRRQAGLQVELIEPDALAERFQLKAPLALWTPHAARVDPYRFARRMLEHLQSCGVRVHARSAVTDWQANATGVQLRLDNSSQVQAAHLVIAAGYESQNWLKRRYATNHSSYALVTEPMAELPLQLTDQVIWESARPYVYLRPTDDGRVLIGGEDDRLDIPAKRDAVLPRKTAKLLKRLRALAPGHEFVPGFAWAGTFAETEDGLPYIGNTPEHGPRVHFAMAYGGNGITYSTLAGAMLRDAILGQLHPLNALFGFGRRR